MSAAARHPARSRPLPFRGLSLARSEQEAPCHARSMRCLHGSDPMAALRVRLSRSLSGSIADCFAAHLRACRVWPVEQQQRRRPDPEQMRRVRDEQHARGASRRRRRHSYGERAARVRMVGARGRVLDHAERNRRARSRNGEVQRCGQPQRHPTTRTGGRFGAEPRNRSGRGAMPLRGDAVDRGGRCRRRRGKREPHSARRMHVARAQRRVVGEPYGACRRLRERDGSFDRGTEYGRAPPRHGDDCRRDRSGASVGSGRARALPGADNRPPQPTCSFTVSPTRVTARSAGEQAVVNVTAQEGCAWTASSSVAWVAVDGGGTGPGSLRLAISANAGNARTGTVTVAGKTVTIEQEAARTSCTYEIKPTSYDAGRGPDDIRVSVTAPGGCAWTATSPAEWVTVAAGRSGSGDGTVRLRVDREQRTGAACGPDHRGSHVPTPPERVLHQHQAQLVPRRAGSGRHPHCCHRGGRLHVDGREHRLVGQGVRGTNWFRRRQGPAARRAEQRCGPLGDADHRGARIRAAPVRRGLGRTRTSGAGTPKCHSGALEIPGDRLLR